MIKFRKLMGQEADASGTFLSGYLYDTTYSELIETFGDPAFSPEDSGDGKVNFEWVFEFDGEIFTVYDWKTYDVEYTMNTLEVWHVGGKSNCTRFIEYIQEYAKTKNPSYDNLI